MRVAILFGGKSVEHQISIRSARNVVTNLDDSHDVYLVGINSDGNWYLQEEVTESIKEINPVSLDMGSNPAHLRTAQHKKIVIDIIFPVLHGTYGEDGGVQGLAQCMNIPVVGSGILGSAVSMDKIVSKELLDLAGIPVAPYLSYHKSEKEKISYAKISEKLGKEFMIKAGNLGSSVGVSKVKNEVELSKALIDSFKYSENILCESFIAGREMECAIIGNKELKASVPGEIVINEDYEFYTYDAKYQDPDAVKIEIPAKVNSKVKEEIKRLCLASYRALRCEDYARVDLFLTSDNKIYINEINTIPGFTDASMFPMLWKQAGVPYNELLSELLEIAMKRWESYVQLSNHYTVN